MQAAVRSRTWLTALSVLVLATGCGGTSEPAPVPPAPTTFVPAAQGWWRDRSVYEVFVRSFADSDGDGVGDFKGLTAHLDYLNDGSATSTKSLGVGAVWLMPINPSPSYHGYDVTDYRDINPAYGTLADFDAFVAAAHQRGIKVVMDFVMNHASSQHPWFQNASQGLKAPKRDWFIWSPTQLSWHAPWNNSSAFYGGTDGYYYGIFCPCMPDLNYRNAAVEEEMVQSVGFWRTHGVDGFRLDAVRYFVESPTGDVADQPETHGVLHRLRGRTEHDYGQTLFVGEAWTDLETVASYYGSGSTAGEELQMAFSFDLASALVSSAQSGDASGFGFTFNRATNSLAGKDRGFEAPFLTNHDMQRVMRALGGDAPAARIAAAALFALPGTPFLYYGEELGMQGGAGGDDKEKRTPFRWNATAPGYGFTSGSAWHTASEAAGVDVETQQKDAGSLWNHYRALLALRRATPALASSDATRAEVVASPGIPGVIALLRGAAGNRRVLFVANFGKQASGPFTVTAAGTPSTLLSEGLTGPVVAANGAISVPGLAARSFVYLALD
jgi:glycosidase